MLSRRFTALTSPLIKTAFMPSHVAQTHWDIFCTVIDNYGDIGVCWRLARQLQIEHGIQVRLWVDDLPAFQKLCSEINPHAAIQKVQDIEVRQWTKDFLTCKASDIGEVVIEAFACHLPEAFVEAMATSLPQPVWINLDYLSAEDWVAGCHALPSPHPRLPLNKYFFFPGFTENTGGLLREFDLETQRQSFCASPQQQREFWQRLGSTAPDANTCLVSLFSYENPALTALLKTWVQNAQPVCCLAPISRAHPALEAFAGRPLQVGDSVQHGALEIRIIPFVSQTDYDRLLWLCDLNLVRGEDSFVRAQWAAQPMIWQIYPQDDDAHQEKLNAFLERYCADLPTTQHTYLHQLFMAWNGSKNTQNASNTWSQLTHTLPEWKKHAKNWANTLKNQEDLCGNLVRFCRSKL